MTRPSSLEVDHTERGIYREVCGVVRALKTNDVQTSENLLEHAENPSVEVGLE